MSDEASGAPDDVAEAGARAPAAGEAAEAAAAGASIVGGPGRAVRAGALVLGSLTAANFIGYAARNALFQAYEDLRGEFHVSNATIGLLTTAFMAAQAAATIPAGWAGDRFDRRKVIGLGLLLASVAGLVGPLLGSFPALLVSRALVGLGLAAIVPVANSILGELYEGDVKASRIAIFNLGLFIGGAVGFAGGQYAGYPNILYLCAVPGFALALAIPLLPIAPHRRSPAVASAASSSTRTSGASSDADAEAPFSVKLRHTLAAVRDILRPRSLRLLMVSTTAMAFAAGGFAAWFVEFLKKDKHLSDGDATSVMIAALVAGLAGVVTGGRLGDAWGRRTRAGRMWTIATGMACAVPSVLACILLPAGAALVAASMATMFFFSWYHAPMAATVDDLASPARAATAQALVVFTMHLLGTSTASWALGALIDSVGYKAAMFLPTATLALAALAMALAVPSFGADSDRARGRST